MRKLNIAYGASRQARKWINKQISFDDLKNRLRTLKFRIEYFGNNKEDNRFQNPSYNIFDIVVLAWTWQKASDFHSFRFFGSAVGIYPRNRLYLSTCLLLSMRLFSELSQ